MEAVPLARLVAHSVSTLRRHQPEDGYYGCFSGGKDSVVLMALCELAGVRCDWHYNVTTVDPPELISFIRSQHANVSWERSPHGSMWTHLANRKCLPPTRRGAWCCEIYKERSPKGRVLLEGVRIEESRKRAQYLTDCRVYDDRRGRNIDTVVPIRLWTTSHVWEFIRSEGIPYCCLYDEGFSRLGCVGCPKANQNNREREFSRWPRFEARWRLAIHRLWDRLAGRIMPRTGQEWYGSRTFSGPESMWQWWRYGIPLSKLRGSDPHR